MATPFIVAEALRQKRTVEQRTQVFRGLQVLRAVAAVLVVCTHAGFYVSERLLPGYDYWKEGATGVDIFFVLSGFVMIHSSRSLMTNPHGWAIFAERRMVRIVPLYWIATTIKLVLVLAGTAEILHARAGLWQALCSYLFLPSYNMDHQFRPLLGVGWTLNFEMFFYLLFALCMVVRANVYWTLGTIFVALAMCSSLLGASGRAFSFYMNPIVLDFLYGMLIARVFHTRATPRNPIVAATAFALGLVGLLSAVPSSFALLHGVAAALIVWSSIALEPFLSRVPRWALFLGDASYAIYLFHPMIAPLAPAALRYLHLPIASVSIALSAILGVVTGCAVHLLMELPITRFLRARLRFQGERIIHVPETSGAFVEHASGHDLHRDAAMLRIRRGA